jgi:hypothetical protein
MEIEALTANLTLNVSAFKVKYSSIMKLEDWVTI